MRRHKRRGPKVQIESVPPAKPATSAWETIRRHEAERGNSMRRGFAQPLRRPGAAFKRALRQWPVIDRRGDTRTFVPEPSEVVIWGASSLLSLVVGLGVAFFFWMALHRAGQPVVADRARGEPRGGVGADRAFRRAPAAAAIFRAPGGNMVVAYALGGPEFARLFRRNRYPRKPRKRPLQSLGGSAKMARLALSRREC